MKLSVSVLFLSALVASPFVCGEAYADCSYPQAPDKVPDGATASKDEMVKAMIAIRAFDSAIKAYTDCLKLEHDTAVAKIDPALSADKVKAQKSELDSVWAKKNDAAIDQDTAIAKQFNEQVKVFNARPKGKS